MQVGTLFTRVIPQARNRGFMLLAGFDAALSQKTMVRYVTLSSLQRTAIDAALAEVTKMLGAKEVQDVTKADIQKKIDKANGVWAL